MIDIFDRVKCYENEDREKSWGTEWVTYDIQENPKGWSCASPRKATDNRRLFIGSYIYADNGFDSDDKVKEAELLHEKEKILSKLRKLAQYNHICRIDYCSVKSIQENQKSIGYDVLLRYVPKKSISEYAGEESQKTKISNLLKDTSQEKDEQRNQVAASLFEDLSYALQELSQAELPHGHINPDHVLLNTESEGAKFLLSPPGYERLLLSEEKDRKNTDFYTAPELVEDPNHPFDVQSDLYSSGMLLYQILNEGRLPFEVDGVSPEEAAKKRISGNEEIPLPMHGSRILQYIARKACAHDREVRYQSAEEMLADLEHMNSSVLSGFDPMEICTLSLVAKKRNEEERLQKEEEEKSRKEEEKKKKEEEKQKQIEAEENRKKKKRQEQQQMEAFSQHPSSENGTASHISFPDRAFWANKGQGSDFAAVSLQSNAQTGNTSVAPPDNNMQQHSIASGSVYQENFSNGDKKKNGRLIAFLIVLIIVTIVLLLLAIGVVKAIVSSSNEEDELNSSHVASVQIENSEKDTVVEEQTEPSTGTETMPVTTTTTTASSVETTVEIAVKTAIGGAAAVETPTAAAAQTGNYQFISGKYTWDQAEKYCEEHGGHLATIHSEADWNAIIQVVTNAQNSNSDLKYIWLGATSTLNDDMTLSFNWVDCSDTSYIMGTSFMHWFYNANIGQSEPSGYDAYEYVNSGTLIREPYLLLWYVASSEGAAKEWSLNDVCDVSDNASYKDSNMGFVMQLD